MRRRWFFEFGFSKKEGKDVVRVQVLWRDEFNQARFIYVHFNRDRLLFKTNANSTLLPYTATTLPLLDALKHSTKSRFVQQNHIFVQQENVTVLRSRDIALGLPCDDESRVEP